MKIDEKLGTSHDFVKNLGNNSNVPNLYIYIYMATELVLTLFQGGDSQVCNHPEVDRIWDVQKHSHFGAVYNVSGLTDNYQIDVYIYTYLYIHIYIYDM